MKKFETPIVEIERFELTDTIAVSLWKPPSETVPSFTLPDDDFENSNIKDFYAK